MDRNRAEKRDGNCSDKREQWILAGIMGGGVFATILHLIYIVQAYRHCSIIFFIAKELW